MSTWKPTLPQGESPLYLAIANSIAEDIAKGATNRTGCLLALCCGVALALLA